MHPASMIGIIFALVIFGSAAVDQIIRNNFIGSAVLFTIGAVMIVSFILMGRGYENSR